MIIHPIKPVFDKNSKILILGSFPSVKSREAEFFYAHPQNRFWKVLAAVFNDTLPLSTEEKKRFLLKHNVALYDVIQSCDINKSSDASVKNVVPADLTQITNHSKVTRIFVNGKTAEKYYNTYSEKTTGIKCVCLPSTSPANAAFSLEKLISEWQVIKHP